MSGSFKTFLSFFVFLLLQVSTYAQDLEGSLSQELSQIMEDASINGLGVAIYTRDSLLYGKGFGLASEENAEAYTVYSRQKIASVSKMAIGVALMKAQEMGLLKPDDDVNTYLPFELRNPHHPKKTITIRHLASHTAGMNKLMKNDLRAIYAPTKIPKIKDELSFGLRKVIFNRFIKMINENEDLPLQDFLFNLYDPNGKWYSKKQFINKAPGEKTCYSNGGASLLALILEKASGMTYEAFLQEHIFDPLGRRQTSFDFQSTNTADQNTSLYHAGMMVPVDYRLLVYPAGGLESTVYDFYLFMAAFSGPNSILTEESMNVLLNPRFGDLTHGVLWNISENYIGHAGDILGATTFAYFNVEKEVGYILFCNTGGTKTLYKETDAIKSTLKSYFDPMLEAVKK